MDLKIKILVNIIRLLSLTWRFKITGKIPTQPAIVVFWHGFMLPVWKYFSKIIHTAQQKKGISQKAGLFGVVSQSRDGEILSMLLESWDYKLIRGSAATGGKEVLRQIVEIAPESYVLMTPDGAKGPIYRMKPGAAVAAQRAGAPLYLCKVNLKWQIRIKKSWDKFSVPLPFAKINLSFSESIYIPGDKSREEITKIVKKCEEEMGK